MLLGQASEWPGVVGYSTRQAERALVNPAGPQEPRAGRGSIEIDHPWPLRCVPNAQEERAKFVGGLDTRRAKEKASANRIMFGPEEGAKGREVQISRRANK